MPLADRPPAQRRILAASLSIDDQYAYQIIKGIRTASPALARQWHEVEPSDSLWALRPDDWFLIWPYLIGSAGAPDVPTLEGK